MGKVDQNFTGNCILSIEYTAGHSDHLDNFYCNGVNLWRDGFTQKQLGILIGREVGERFILEDRFVHTAYDTALQKRLARRHWAPPKELESQPEPRRGRWYPKGFLQGVGGVYPQMTDPMRIVEANDESVTVDLNHPLAGYELRINLQTAEASAGRKERGGRCHDWIREVLDDGPGMQLLPQEGEVDFNEIDGMNRLTQGDDLLFYKQPRLVDHIDAQAREHLYRLGKSIITEDMRVLDLMSSMQSHLPSCRKLTGLGMNAEELRSNAALTDYLVHDLNNQPQLPFADSSYEAICCHLSFEYLLYPSAVLAECARVLTRNGVLFISFSNRWFPEKVTKIWQMLHEFERLGYVMQHVHEHFIDIKTFTYRNWPRPYDDPHFLKLQTSDPLYAVTAGKRMTG